MAEQTNHFREAERLLESCRITAEDDFAHRLAAAQIHAMLAQTAAYRRLAALVVAAGGLPDDEPAAGGAPTADGGEG